MMNPHELTFSQAERLQEVDGALQMDQDTFRALYEQTARSLWVFLWRKTSDAQLADDLLQETYYRFLRARASYESDAHRRNYLFRIAANLANDSHRRRINHESLSVEDKHEVASNAPDIADGNQKRTDLNQAMLQLPPKQRDALWLAYMEGSSHEEIAGVLGMKTASIKLLLFRARRKLAKMLQGRAG